MAIPISTPVWAEVMDPYDIADYEVDCSLLLDEEDSVSSYSVIIPAESSLVGLTLGSVTYAPTLTDNILRIWLSIAPEEQGNILFNGAGTVLPVEINITTTSLPPRRKQRTVAVKVAHR